MLEFRPGATHGLWNMSTIKVSSTDRRRPASAMAARALKVRGNGNYSTSAHES